jgi:trehalose 6-phosphate phosphatase
VAPLLDTLAGRFAVVAVVSGRRAADVAARAGVGPPVRVFGLYGLEDERGPTSPDAGALIAAAERALPDVERAAAYVPESLVEPKGLQTAVHYRAAPEPEAARRVLLERLGGVARSHGLRLLEGKRVVEVAADGTPTKGDVVEEVARAHSLGGVLYAGDDLADLEAFAALDRLAGQRVVTAKVAVRSAEAPQALLDGADVVVDGPRGLLELLEELAG